jgi:ABC-type polysaccharide/polyol phosphate export permease
MKKDPLPNIVINADMPAPKNWLWIPLVLLLLAVLAYFFYRKYNEENKTN